MLEAERPDLVIVPGDVNSTLAAALVAAKLGIPIAHVEAGLRSFDRTMPEEINRIVADEFAEDLFIHSPTRRSTTCGPRASPEDRIYFVGNTMIDSLVSDRATLPRTSMRPSALGLRGGRLPAGHAAPSRAGRRSTAVRACSSA